MTMIRAVPPTMVKAIKPGATTHRASNVSNPLRPILWFCRTRAATVNFWPKQNQGPRVSCCQSVPQSQTTRVVVWVIPQGVRPALAQYSVKKLGPAPLVLPTTSRACTRGHQQNSASRKRPQQMLGTVGRRNRQFCYETSGLTVQGYCSHPEGSQGRVRHAAVDCGFI